MNVIKVSKIRNNLIVDIEGPCQITSSTLHRL